MSIYKTKFDNPPVVSIRIKLKDPHEIDKLSYEVSKVIKTDPILRYRMDRESGAFMLMGMDIFYLENLAKIINEQVEIDIGEPQVIYRERIFKKSKEIRTKSANTRNTLS